MSGELAKQVRNIEAMNVWFTRLFVLNLLPLCGIQSIAVIYNIRLSLISFCEESRSFDAFLFLLTK